MTYCRVCKVCGHKVQQIPMRHYDTLIMLEYYCPHCETSEVKYETIIV